MSMALCAFLRQSSTAIRRFLATPSCDDMTLASDTIYPAAVDDLVGRTAFFAACRE